MDVSQAFKSRSMKSMLGDRLLRNGLPRIKYDNKNVEAQAMKLLPGPSDVSCTWRQHKVGSVLSNMNKFVRKAQLRSENSARRWYQQTVQANLQHHRRRATSQDFSVQPVHHSWPYSGLPFHHHR
uniref:Uncharacterized protein n=1 Tax=Opuntia streptacantha TaxID=393608 RepID=A0A7C9CIT9_OPUST